MDLNGEIAINIIIVGMNTPLTSMDRSCRQKINKEILTLNNMLKKIGLIDIYKTLYPKSIRIHIFKGTWNIFQDMSYVRPQNTSK